MGDHKGIKMYHVHVMTPHNKYVFQKKILLKIKQLNNYMGENLNLYKEIHNSRDGKT